MDTHTADIVARAFLVGVAFGVFFGALASGIIVAHFCTSRRKESSDAR
jgi:hypothetical protein